MLLPSLFSFIKLAVFYHCFSTEVLHSHGKNQNTPPSATLGADVKIQHLHVLFRHGDRSPISDRIHSKEEFQNMWPAGYGQLTDIGIYQEFQLGQWIRSKYNSFIPWNYSASEFHMRSTDIDRTLISAQSLVAGIFLNASSSSPLAPFGLRWRPIPIHTVPQREDILLSLADCPCLKVLQNVEMDSESSLEFERKHGKLFHFLRNVTNDASINRNTIWEFYDILTCMRAHNYSMPAWYNESLYEEITTVQRFYWNQKFASTDTIVRLEIGVFLRVFVDHILAIVDGTPLSHSIQPDLSVQHTMVYSAHDTDVTFLLAAFGAYDHQIVPYAAAVVIELVGPDPPAPRDRYRLRLRYKRGYMDNEARYLPFRACPIDRPAEQGCSLDQVLTYLDTFVIPPSQFDRECAIEQQQWGLLRSTTPFSCAQSRRSIRLAPILVVSLLTVTLCAIGLTFGLYARRRLRHSRRLLDCKTPDTSSFF